MMEWMIGDPDVGLKIKKIGAQRKTISLAVFFVIDKAQNLMTIFIFIKEVVLPAIDRYT